MNSIYPNFSLDLHRKLNTLE